MQRSAVIVDDHPLLRDALRLRLTREPGMCVVAEASNTEEAKEVIGRLKPDLVILDVQLPGEGGLAIARWTRVHSPQTKIVVLTGFIKPTTVQDALQAGVNGFVAKDSAGDELVRAIRAVLAGETYLTESASRLLAEATRLGRSAQLADLSARELAVLKGIAAGKTYKEIAGELTLSVKTIETYRLRLVRKTGCRSKVSLAKFAVNLGLVAS